MDSQDLKLALEVVGALVVMVTYIRWRMRSWTGLTEAQKGFLKRAAELQKLQKTDPEGAAAQFQQLAEEMEAEDQRQRLALAAEARTNPKAAQRLERMLRDELEAVARARVEVEKQLSGEQQATALNSLDEDAAATQRALDELLRVTSAR